MSASDTTTATRPESSPDLDAYRAKAKARQAANPVKRMHHHAFLAKDMEETRHFYEDILGFPLVGTWIERFNPVTNKPDNYLHTFFELGDGSCLAFFQFKDADYNKSVTQNEFNNNNPFFHHMALEVEGMEALEAFKKRLKEHNIEYVDTDHGYCYSIYFYDPNGMQVELTTNVATTEEQFAKVGPEALETMRDWLAHDDVATNNETRAKEGWVKNK